MTGSPTIADLFKRVEQLLAEADRLTGDDKPLWKRVWYASRAKEMTSEAQDLLDEVSLRMGMKPRHDAQPERFGRLTRRHLLVLQWFVGIWNAISAIWAAVDGRWIACAFSLLSMFVCTLWVLPRKPRRTRL
jgi:hypothetical protein